MSRWTTDEQLKWLTNRIEAYQAVIPTGKYDNFWAVTTSEWFKDFPLTVPTVESLAVRDAIKLAAAEKATGLNNKKKKKPPTVSIY